MHPTDIDSEVVAANPWWRDPTGWEEQDVQLRVARGTSLQYEPQPLSDMSVGGLYILRGPRRVGKSTALKQLVRDRIRSGSAPRRILHISVEGRDAQDLVDLVRGASERWLEGEPGTRLWLIDEVTAVHGAWPEAVKRLRDGHPSFSTDTVVLTGSSSERFDEAQKLLAGRRGTSHSDRVLLPMRFVDVAAALGTELPPSPELGISELADDARLRELVPELRPWVEDLTQAWERYLWIGGYPQVVAAGLDAPGSDGAALRNALWDVVQGDAFAGSGLSQTQSQTILRGLGASLTSLLSVSALGRAAKLDKRTTDRRLESLRRAFIAFPVPREQGLAPKPRSQSKWYFMDPQLAGIASSFGVGGSPDASGLSEQQLAVALLRALERREPGAAIRHDRLLYYRSATRAEIDFVSPDFATTCVESKYVDSAWGRAFQTIEASGRSTGLVATRSGLRRHDGGWALPAGLLVFLIGC